MFNPLQNSALAFLKQRFFNAYLKIQHVGSRRRGQTAGRLSGYLQVAQALIQYPLSATTAQAYLRPLSQPQPLKTWAQVEDSFACVLNLGLPAHKGREKNWDFLAAFSAIVERGKPQDVIVDLGSGNSSVILEWLHLYGYHHLHGCDLIVAPRRDGRIEYTQQDLEKTTYPDGFADVVTCLSVIEHGVNPAKMLAESSRLLKPGGLLLISTDYWCETRDLTGVRDELGQVYVFSPHALQTQLLAKAADYGLEVVGTPDFACGDAVVNRPNVPELHRQYTFYFLKYKKNIKN